MGCGYATCCIKNIPNQAKTVRLSENDTQKHPKKAKKREKCNIFSGCQSIFLKIVLNHFYICILKGSGSFLPVTENLGQNGFVAVWEVGLTVCQVYAESHDQDHFEKFGQSFFLPNQIVLLCLPHRATCVLHLLKPWSATMTQTIAAAANALKTSHSHVLLTQPLELQSGSQLFALQKAVAAKVSGGVRFGKKCS